jgi:site-specific recombinase XerD
MYRKRIKHQDRALGHSTYIMECRTSLRYIQVALGHNSSKAAEIYTRVLAMNNKTIKSLLDNIYESVNLDKHKTTS